MNSIVSKAQELVQGFEIAINHKGQEYYRVKDNFVYNKQLTEIIYKCHEGHLPNDWIFSTVNSQLLDISEQDINSTTEDLLGIINTSQEAYTKDLLDWANYFYEYCDEAIEEYVIYDLKGGIIKILAQGQNYHVDKIIQILLSELEELELSIHS